MIGLATRWLGADVTSGALVEIADELHVRSFRLDAVPSRPAAMYRALRPAGVTICAVAVEEALAVGERFPSSAARAAEATAALKGAHVVVEGGGLGGALEADLEAALEAWWRDPPKGDDPSREALLRRGTDARESAADRAVRLLHPLVGAGVPLAVRNGRGWHELLGFEELGWVLDELPGLRFWFDPARAERASRTGTGPDLIAWIERFASRCVGVSVSGLGDAGRGGRHPEDGGPSWSTLFETLPRGGMWVLDVDPDLGRDAVADAARFLRAHVG